MEVNQIIRLLKSEKELLQKVNNSGKKERLSGYEIATIIDSFLQDNQVISPEFLIRIQGMALFEGDRKIIFTEVKSRIIDLGKGTEELAKIGDYKIEAPEKKTELSTKLELILQIKDFIAQNKIGYLIVALIDSYAKLLDINSIPILIKIRKYAYRNGIKPLSLTEGYIDKNSVASILRKSILLLNEKIYRSKRFPEVELQPEEEQLRVQNKILRKLNQVNNNTKSIKDIQIFFLIVFIIEFVISFYIGFTIGLGI